MKTIYNIFAVSAMAAALAACTMDGFMDADGPMEKGDYYSAYDAEPGAYIDGEGAGESAGREDGDGSAIGNSNAGRVTAGEWCDLDNWTFWGGLMTGDTYASQSEGWGFYTNNLVAVKVQDTAGEPVKGLKVELVRGGSTIWKAVTDNRGRASLWIGLFQKDNVKDNGNLSVSIAGEIQAEAPVVSGWDVQQGAILNTYTVSASSNVENAAEIAFIVDATGSMGDEMDFLKDDLKDIINKVGAFDTSCKIRTAALFYRDEGDEYVTKQQDFKDSVDETVKYVGKQEANGGGDYPEAVHTALEKGLQNLSWKENAGCKLAFILLDAPAHQTQEGVLASLHSSIQKYAENGIKVIPIAASGVDKSTEFMLRFFSISTSGTYVFLTNDSGIGGDHIQASVGDYKVEQLNDLIVRLIKQYIQ